MALSTAIYLNNINRWSGPSLLSRGIESAETRLISLQDRQRVSHLYCKCRTVESGVIVNCCTLCFLNQSFSLFQFQTDRQTPVYQ
jgi:hypothetical protein